MRKVVVQVQDAMCGRGSTGAWRNSGVKAQAATSEMGQGKDAVSGKTGATSVGRWQSGTGISGREAALGSNSGRVGISWATGRKGVGSRGKATGNAAKGWAAGRCLGTGATGGAGARENDCT